MTLLHPLIQKLKTLDLPTKDYAVFGSGPMMAHGLTESNDLDIIARGEAWKKAKATGAITKTKSGNDKVEFFDGAVEIFDSWINGEWDINTLINEAEIIDGIPFVRLEEVLHWKKNRSAPKDAEHSRLIEEYLAKK